MIHPNAFYSIQALIVNYIGTFSFCAIIWLQSRYYIKLASRLNL